MSEMTILLQQIKEKQGKVDSLYNEIKDFSTSDYVRTERVGKLILSIRGEINALNKKVKDIEKKMVD